MPELYKYCKREHAEALVKNGTLRIGTLYDWRKANLYGELVGDPDDGLIHLNGGGNLIFRDDRFVDDLKFHTLPGDQSIPNSLGSIKTVYCDNVYTFSAASSYSLVDHQQWKLKEGYDACVKMHDAMFFAVSVTASEGFTENKLLLVAPVLYFDPDLKNNEFNEQFHPALVKGKAFGNQSEIRIIWRPPPGKEIEPIILSRSHAYRQSEIFAVI